MKRKIFALIMLAIITFGFASGCTQEVSNEPYMIDGKEIVFKVGDNYLTADDLFGKISINSENLDSFYNEVRDVVIKRAAPVDQTMINTVDSEIDAWELRVKNTANTNGTSYAEAKEAALETEGVESLEELRENKLFALQVKKAKDRYWKNEEQNYFNSYIEENLVFHISSIFVSISQTSTLDMVQKTLSDNEAEKIADISNRLVNGEKFYNVALLSDDSETKDNGGDMGLVSLITSELKQEIKYALLAYAKYQQGATINIDTGAYLDSYYESGIEAIPSSYIEKLDEVKGLNSSVDFVVNNYEYYSNRMLPRNVIFNSLFNTAGFRYLVDEDENASSKSYVQEYNNVKMPATETQGFLQESSQYIIVNSSSHPILVLRTPTGVYFISINMSPFDQNALEYYDSTPDLEDDFLSYVELAKNDEEKESRIEKLDDFADNYATFSYGLGNENYLEYDMVKQYMQDYQISIVDPDLSSKFESYLTDRINHAKLVFNNLHSANILKISDYIEFSKSSIIQKEFVPLICLETGEKQNCTHTRTAGFVYDGGAD